MLSLLLLLLSQRDAKVPDTDPEVERKSFKVADGFEVTLYASDPLLAKPLQMNFDSAGRLWIASSETYPQIKPGQKADDKILVLEDTKGVGKADKVTVFSGGLLIPTGLEVGDGGVYVVNSTDLEHHSAPDKDGKATKKRVVLSGFGTEDTHHMVHTLRWGHDGNLYFNQSVYIHTHLETPHGPRRLGGGGIWQFRPDTLRAEVFTRGMVNSWGHHFDRWGQSFATDGAGFQGVQPQIPGGAYFWAANSPRVLSGVNPGHPKYCGCEIVSGRHLPDDWQGDLITCDFRAHRVVRFKLAPNGAGYSATLMPDVIKASHPAFRPIDVKMGPDGAIYVADWYNPIIQHGEVDFRDPRRDLTRGRIWRIASKKNKPLANPRLDKMTPEELVKQMAAPEGWTRHFARRQLWELGAKKSLPAVEAWTPSEEAEKLEKLWTLQTFAKPDAKLLGELLEAKDARIRAAAVRVLGAWLPKDALALFERRIADDDIQVRLEAVCALRGIKTPASAALALKALDRAMDQYVDYSLWLTMRELEKHWLPALRAGSFSANTSALAFALNAVGTGKVVGPLVELVKSDKLKDEARARMLALLAKVGGPGELDLVLKEAEKHPKILLPALEEAARERGVLPTQRKLLLPLAKHDRATAHRLIGLFKLKEGFGDLVSLARDPKAEERDRLASIAGLAEFGDEASGNELALIAAQGGAAGRAALIALVRLDLGKAAKLAPDLLKDDKAGDLIDAFLQQKGGASALAKSLAGKKIPADVARVGLRAVRVTGRADEGLASALSKAGGIEGPRKMSPTDIKELVSLAMDKGDAARGEAIYRRNDMQCLKCHAIGGAGGNVGPDLSSIGGSAQPDYLAESLIVPSKAIKEGYHAVLVTTRRGQQYTGVKVRETEASLILRTAEDKEVSIPKRSIERTEPSKVSLMPEGLTDALTKAELADLVRFLSSLGKSESFSVGRERIARRYEVLTPDKAAYDRMGRAGLPGLAAPEAGLTWETAYATVAGRLPVEGLPHLKTFGKDGVPLAMLRVVLEATSAGKAKLKVGDAAGLTLWLDGESVEGTTLSLKPGRHLLTVAVALKERKAPLVVEIADASPDVRFVGGK